MDGVCAEFESISRLCRFISILLPRSRYVHPKKDREHVIQGQRVTAKRNDVYRLVKCDHNGLETKQTGCCGGSPVLDRV